MPLDWYGGGGRGGIGFNHCESKDEDMGMKPKTMEYVLHGVRFRTMWLELSEIPLYLVGGDRNTWQRI